MNPAPIAFLETKDGTVRPDPKYVLETSNATGPQDYRVIILLADTVNDLEDARIRAENRLRALTSQEDWGKGAPDDAFVASLAKNLKALEDGAVLALKREVRKSPLGEWQKATNGVGEKTLGRFIKEVGDPAWHYLYDRPRTLAELRAYCGLHVWPAHLACETQTPAGGPKSGSNTHCSDDHQKMNGVAPHLTRGRQANWSTQAKTRLYLIAESMLKNRKSAFRHVYDDGRGKYAEAEHQVECKRCGPSGKPAPVGSPLSAGHQHARAMRLVMKAVLAEIWQASGGTQTDRENHIQLGSVPASSPANGGQCRSETHYAAAAVSPGVNA